MSTMLTKAVMKQIASESPRLMEKLYNDLLHPPAKEIGILLRDIAKTVCILGYPFMLGAAFHDSLSERVYKTVENVPEKLRVMPNPQLFLEYLDKAKYIPDKSTIINAYDALLSAAVNKEKRDLVHPAFITILSQLSGDEMTMVNSLRNKSYKLEQMHHYDIQTNKFYKTEVVKNEFPLDILHNEEHFFMYCTHLDKLDLVVFPRISSEPKKNAQNVQVASAQTYSLSLSEFGKLFAQVCCFFD
jgi:hypothetical protein